MFIVSYMYKQMFLSTCPDSCHVPTTSLCFSATQSDDKLHSGFDAGRSAVSIKYQ